MNEPQQRNISLELALTRHWLRVEREGRYWERQIGTDAVDAIKGRVAEIVDELWPCNYEAKAR